MHEQLRHFQHRIGYQFRNQELLERSLRHRSAGSLHNERLEFLGDSLLNLIVAEHLFSDDLSATEGELTTRRSLLVRKETLAAAARQFDFSSALQLGPSAAKSGGHDRDSILADAVEAVIAAVYLDGSFELACSVTLRLLQQSIAELDDNLTEHQALQDAKTRLQEWLQARSMPLPRYETLQVIGPGHARNYQVSVRVTPLEQPSLGEGRSRREAEQQAAEQALQQLEKTSA